MFSQTVQSRQTYRHTIPTDRRTDRQSNPEKLFSLYILYYKKLALNRNCWICACIVCLKWPLLLV